MGREPGLRLWTSPNNGLGVLRAQAQPNQCLTGGPVRRESPPKEKVLEGGLEPPQVTPCAPQTHASTIPPPEQVSPVVVTGLSAHCED